MRYRVNIISTAGSTVTEHDTEDEAYRRVTPAERAGQPVVVHEEQPDGAWQLYENHNH